MYRTLEEVYNFARTKGKRRLAIAAGHDIETVKAVVRGKKENIIEPILIGEQPKIEGHLTDLGEAISSYEIHPAIDNVDATKQAIQLVNNHQADFLMKGYLQTSEMLREVVKKDSGMVANNTISYAKLMELEGFDKLIIITDTAIVIEPTLAQKKDILENAVGAFHTLDYDQPKVAILCAVEKENPKMIDTVHAAELKRMNEAGVIKNCLVEGPISFDIAMDAGRAKRKEYQGAIQGDADILLMPDVTSGNILAKALSILGEKESAGFVLGAKVPIILSSRGAMADAKYHSILACLAIL